MKLLWDFDSLRESQIMKLCNCSETDINNLISNKVISKDVKKGILKYAKKKLIIGILLHLMLLWII